MNNPPSSDKQSVAYTYSLMYQRLEVSQLISKLENELAEAKGILTSINNELGMGAGHTKPQDIMSNFVYDCELHKLCTQKADTETQKEVIEKLILSKRKSSESKIKNISRDYIKWKQRLARFRKELLSD